MNITYRYLLLLLVTGAAIAAAFFMQAIPQPAEYHEFIDSRTLYGVTNFWNIATNIGFVIFGIMGLISTINAGKSNQSFGLQHAYGLFFTASILIGLGSAFYHLQPSNDSLLWDRLPMSFAFMAMFTIIFSEHIVKKGGGLLLWPLLFIGAWSVLYWYKSEQLNMGDLRPYILVQFLPMILIYLMLLLFKTPGHTRIYLWLIILVYALSKGAEHYDQLLFDTTGYLSGHSIKHILASLAVLFFHLHLLAKPAAVVATDDDE